MDRNTVTGLILIFVIMMAWAFYAMPSEEDLQRQREEQALQDSIAAVEREQEQQLMDEEEVEEDIDTDRLPSPDIPVDEEQVPEQVPDVTGIFQSGYSDTTFTTVRTSRYKTIFTNIGGGPVFYELENYNTWDQVPVQMIGDTTSSAYLLGFLSTEGYNIETDNLVFRPLHETDELVLEDDETGQLSYILELENGSSITYTYTFHAERFEIDLDIQMNNIRDLIIGNSIDFGWKPSLNFTEKDPTQDGTYASAYIYAGGVLENFVVDGSSRNEMTVNGTIDWVSTKTKFFTQIIKPDSPTNAAILTGEVDGPKDEADTRHHYQTAVQSPIPDNGHLRYELYIGPLDYYQLREFDEQAFEMVEISYAWMRWFADPLVKWIIIPYFAFASNYIANYGLLIILFGVLIKLVLYPLTKKSFKSMAAMKELQPQMKEIQEKYKDNPKKQQEATIKLYKKAKVNPIGGCLPMLLQFPILITLWRYFQSSILIRQEPFLWASDLSAPDYILNLPFGIPFLGDQLAGFVLLMTGAMIVQMKVSGGMSGGAAPSGGPNMKVFMYFMPVMLLFIFNNFAAGLSLYYLVYNIMSIGQQFLINRQVEIEKNNGGEENEKPDLNKMKAEKRKKKKKK